MNRDISWNSRADTLLSLVEILDEMYIVWSNELLSQFVGNTRMN